MVTTKQAAEIRQQLINQLTINGYGDIMREAITRLDFNDYLDYQKNPTESLNQFVGEIARVFESFSNSNYDVVLEKLNASLSSHNKVERIVLQPDNDNARPVDMRSLPDYRNIIVTLRDIQSIIIS